MDPAQRNSVADALSIVDIWQSKARTLARLATLVRASRVPESLSLDFAQWCRSRNHTLAQIQLRFGQQGLAVRSSRHDEDGCTQSQAGRYRTELNVPAQAADSVSAAVDAVFRSYGAALAKDEVLIQPMVAGARACYVAATHTFDAGAPYYVLDFAPGERTDLVTRGTNATTTIYVAHAARYRDLDDDARRILRALREVHRLQANAALEAEFVLSGHEVFLLQARPIASTQAAPEIRSATLLRESVRQSLNRREATHSSVLGNSNLYGLMPDWNPAELLGAHPRPLALSLFRRLITQANWRRARAALGYRELAAGDLLQAFAGRPYVDVRMSFNSLLPMGIAADVGARLIDAWIARLRAAPNLHDRVEFEVASTCVDFDFVGRHQTRYPGVLDARELREYRERLLLPTRKSLDRALLLRAHRTLCGLHRRLTSGDGKDGVVQLRRAGVSGAKPYAQIARQAFVIEALLRSAERCGALSAQRLQALRHSADGVTGEFLDAWANADSEQAQEDLRDRFGHLRPGTFEITVPNYAMASAGFLVDLPAKRAQRKPSFVLTASERESLNALSAQSGIALGADDLVGFYCEAVRVREHGKFVLSQAVSVLLEAIAHWGRSRELDRNVLTWLKIESIVAGHGDVGKYKAEAEQACRRYEVERQLKLPALLSAHDDLSIVRSVPGTPSFHGRGVIEARVVEVTRHTRPLDVPVHCILAIESADPGFDWIFARAPAALLTAYGGPNSHMAIRCAELHCPALLGLGVEGLRRAIDCLRLTLDFDSGTLRGAIE